MVPGTVPTGSPSVSIQTSASLSTRTTVPRCTCTRASLTCRPAMSAGNSMSMATRRHPLDDHEIEQTVVDRGAGRDPLPTAEVLPIARRREQERTLVHDAIVDADRHRRHRVSPQADQPAQHVRPGSAPPLSGWLCEPAGCYRREPAARDIEKAAGALGAVGAATTHPPCVDSAPLTGVQGARRKFRGRFRAQASEQSRAPFRAVEARSPRRLARPLSKRPLSASLTVPSPPAMTRRVAPRSAAMRAKRKPSPSRSVQRSS